MTGPVQPGAFRPPEILPAELRNANAWLLWRLTHVPGETKPRKVPHYANGNKRYGEQGSEQDRAQMVSFDRAVAAGAKGQYSGLGFALQADLGLVALDFDNVVVDGVVDPRVLDIVSGTYAELSPSGSGVRAFFRGALADRKDHNAGGRHAFAVEVFHAKGFVTITGNLLPQCELFGFAETVAPLSPAVLAMYRERFPEGGAAAGFDDLSDERALLAMAPKVGLSLAQIFAGLDLLDPDCGYEDWLRIGQSIHHETDGGDEGLEAWREWSGKSSKYPGDRGMDAKWRSFGRYSGPPITGAFFLKQVTEAKRLRGYEGLRRWKDRIGAEVDEFALREQVCPEIAKDSTLTELDRAALAQALCDKFKALGTNYPIALVRKSIAEKRQAKPTPENLPAWAQGWVYVTDEDKFFRIDSDEWLTMQAFNARFNRELARDADGTVTKSAAWLCLEDFRLRTVTRAVYLPWATEPIFSLHGVECVNLYRPSSVPKASERLSPAGRRAVDLVLAHLRLLAGGREDVVQTLVAYLAHNVQKPGVKIRFSPLIKGVEGDGKTLLGELLAAVMGRPNVTNISPKVLATDFNGYAEGACVGVLEEIKLAGHNRHDTLNAMKPLITNDSIAIHRKGRDEYNIINTMNFVGFTNFGDALPLNDTDRRWMIIFTPFATIEEMAAVCGSPVGGLGAYFDALHAAIQMHPAELRRWLLDYPIPDTFKPNGSAPMTDEKAVMVSLNRSTEDQVAREVIAAGGLGISERVLSSKLLSEAMLMHEEAVTLQTKALSTLLVRMGYTKWPERVRWQGDLHYVWVRGRVPSSLDQVKTLLDKTTTSGGGQWVEALFAD